MPDVALNLISSRYLHQENIIFMAISLFVCLLLAGLHKHYWLDLPEKNQKRGFGRLASH